MTSVRIAGIRIAIAAALAAALFAGGSAHARPASAHTATLTAAAQYRSPVACCDE